jgi:predicted GNAT family acetyltransferase
MLHLESFATATDFLRVARGYLERNEVVAGLMLGLAIRLEGEPLAFGDHAPYFAVVRDGQEPALAALMTPPYNLALYAEQEAPPAALELVAANLHGERWPVSGVTGPGRLSDGFAAAWTRRTGVAGRPGLATRIYELRRVIPPRAVTGGLRVASATDADLVVAWVDAFHREAVPDQPPASAEATRRRLAAGVVHLWEDGAPVSMAMKTRPTAHGVSIGDVYTPPELRRRGYASACVAALSQQLLDAGFAYCTLFTDLSNPTSNAIYQQIGYRPVCDFRELKFDPAA